MSQNSIGVAVIGAGMAGKAHAAAYRNAPTLYDSVLPPIRLVSIADVYEPAAKAAAERFGYERYDTSWQAIVDADDIDVVSVVVANSLHREIVEALLAAGKHVLCEKPLSDTIEDAEAMADAARDASSISRVGFTFRRAPGIAYLHELVETGVLGQVYHVSARYWTDYAANPQAAMSWRFRGGPGTGALADLGSHVTYLMEFLGGDIATVGGGRFSTVITERPLPLGAVAGHGSTNVSDEYESVQNDDYATFNLTYTSGGAGTVEVSRVAQGHPNSLTLEVFGANGSARWDQVRPSEIQLFLPEGESAQQGVRRVLLGSEHPYLAGAAPIDMQSVGFGQNEGFVFQARAMLEEVAGIPESESLPRNASFDDGLHNMLLLDAATRSALQGGASITIER